MWSSVHQLSMLIIFHNACNLSNINHLAFHCLVEREFTQAREFSTQENKDYKQENKLGDLSLK